VTAHPDDVVKKMDRKWMDGLFAFIIGPVDAGQCELWISENYNLGRVFFH